MNDTPSQPPFDELAEQIRRLERRLARIEARLELSPLEEAPLAAAPASLAKMPPAGAPAPGGPAEIRAAASDDGEFEYEVGQNWFAKIGIVALAVGVAFLLSLPFPGYPAAAPSLVGFGFAGALFLLAHLGRNSFELVSKYFRGAAMLLLFFAALRLFFFGINPALNTAAPAGRALLLLVVGANLSIALRRRSPYLFGLAAALGFATAVAVGTPWFVFAVITAAATIIVAVRHRHDWPAIAVIGSVAAYASYTIWAIGNPFLGNEFKIVKEPLAGPFFVLAWVAVFALASLLRRNRATEDPATQIGAVLNCGAGYLVFLLHALLGFGSAFMLCNLVASVVFLALAVAFWVREQSRFSTFVYAMTGYMALSFAIIKAFSVPDVFVWLSLQSLVVVTTAIWFRSRFIVVANFLIYAAIVLGYIGVAKEETGISLGFGIVALLSARILNWKKERLELRTEIMRNAYLASAFCVFPYALYHLVPHAWVIPAWVGIAVTYYLLNLVIRNVKYRWMGHGTLLLAAVYAVVVGLSRLQGAQRILSFLVLGSILLIVSLIFTRLRARRRSTAEKPAGG
jgi:hypothetical protein